MKYVSFLAAGILSLTISCNSATEQKDAGATDAAVSAAGQSAVQDNDSQKDVVKVAIGSKDHTTLVAALQAASYVDVLSNAGPFTVFAPTNAAFDLLPKGTLDDGEPNGNLSRWNSTGRSDSIQHWRSSSSGIGFVSLRRTITYDHLGWASSYPKGTRVGI